MNKETLITHLKEKKREYQQHIKDIEKMLKEIEAHTEPLTWPLDSVKKDYKVK